MCWYPVPKVASFQSSSNPRRHGDHVPSFSRHKTFVAWCQKVSWSKLSATNNGENNNNNNNNARNNKAKGVYVRPSGAIERGSGFFVPGLEGPKVRVLFGIILLGLTAINHSLGSPSSSWTNSLSLEEGITIAFSGLVLFQAAIEYGKEELLILGDVVSTGTGSRGSSNVASLLQRDLVQQWNVAAQSKLSQEKKDKIQWAAACYLSVTPATQMLLLTKEDLILYRLGSDSGMDGDKIDEGVKAALNQLRQSKGGRIALPESHPAVVALRLTEARTVVLQRITEESCWVMSSSDQLLARFTPADLKWLGQLAKYVT